MLIDPKNYETFLVDTQTSKVVIHDHLGGFDKNFHAPVLDRLFEQCHDRVIEVKTFYIVHQKVKDNYPNFNFVFSPSMADVWLNHFFDYQIHPVLTFENFLCTFNGTPHVSRKILLAILYKFGFFNPKFSTKNFCFSASELSGHITDFTGDRDNFFSKFFSLPAQDKFYNEISSFGHHRYQHAKNIYVLDQSITKSFLHLVSETMATSYQPLYSEKFLYSVATRGLFLSYAQPNWHHLLEKHLGFRLYTKLFDYSFDQIENPIERVLELMSMITKFSKLSPADWSDLYLLEQDSIEFNYNHYFSGEYLKFLHKVQQN